MLRDAYACTSSFGTLLQQILGGLQLVEFDPTACPTARPNVFTSLSIAKPERRASSVLRRWIAPSQKSHHPSHLSRVDKSPEQTVQNTTFTHLLFLITCKGRGGGFPLIFLSTACGHVSAVVRPPPMLSSTHSVPSSHHDCLLQCSDVLSYSHNPTTQQSNTKKKTKWT